MITDVAAASGGAPDGLTLELNERALVETDAPGILDELHQMGAHVAVDDFGSGYSSLAYLVGRPSSAAALDDWLSGASQSGSR